MMQELQISMVPERVLGANQVRALINAVRDKLLTWVLDLTETGIRLVYPPGAAAGAGEHLHRGDAPGFQFMQRLPGGQQQQTVTGEQKAEALAALLPWLQQVIAEGLV